MIPNGITEAACVAMTIGPVCEWIVGTIDQAENAKGLLEAGDGLETLVKVSTVDDPYTYSMVWPFPGSPAISRRYIFVLDFGQVYEV